MRQPKISCLLAVKPGCEVESLRAVEDFSNQIYDSLELIVVSSVANEIRAERWLAFLAQLLTLVPDVIVATFDGSFPLGEMLVNANQLATGDLACVWECRARHHPDRLDVQLSMLSPDIAGVALADRLELDHLTRELRWVDYRLGGASGSQGLDPATLLFRRKGIKIPTIGPDSDEPALGLFHAVANSGAIAAVTNRGWLLVRDRRDDRLAKYRRSVSSKELYDRKGVLVATLGGYSGRSQPISVIGNTPSCGYAAVIGAS
jgi:hypothetical protein